ncbi:E2 [Canis familiaris papillomavirus 15]|uniref:Regulatory protein E2 n=1 Tax=Canis familiaris papillomavirus 15 TaxID=1272519 RepID=L0CKE1_9PAPI|nr:E2 [Canis familiaris papillomavirus 15]
METLSKRLNALQDALLNLYEEASDELQRQVDHWKILRQENVLLHYARKSGVLRVGMQPVPPLQVSAERAKHAIEMQIVLQSLCDSQWASETWTLADTSRELWTAAPQRCFKKGACIVEVIYDGDPDNCMQYTLWSRVYYQDGSDTWQMSRSQVDCVGIWFWDCEQKRYYVKFANDAARYGTTGTWEVVYNGETVTSSDPVTSTTPPTDPCGEAPVYHRRLSPHGPSAGDANPPIERGGGDRTPASTPETATQVSSTYTSPLPDTTSPSPRPLGEVEGDRGGGGGRGATAEPVGSSPLAAAAIAATPVSVPRVPLTPRKRPRGRGPSEPPCRRQPPPSPGEPEPAVDPGLVPVCGRPRTPPITPQGGQPSPLTVPVAEPRPVGSLTPPGGGLPPSPAPPAAEAAREPARRYPPAGARRLAVPGGHPNRPGDLLREAGHLPQTAVVLCGPANALKCLRYRLQHHHGQKFLTVSTTWYWAGQGSSRLGPARIMLTFRDSQQQTDFFQSVRLPPSISRAPSIFSV